MTDRQPNETALALSEEVQDILHLAQKTARQERRSGQTTDQDLLAALLKVNRLFTRQDALLKQAGTSAKSLEQIFKQEKTQQTGEQPVDTVLEQAKAFAQAGQTTSSKPRVEIEHLLMAMLASPDPLVQSVLQKGGLNQEKLNAVLPQVKADSPKRFALYCIRETLEVVCVVLFLVIIIKQGLGEFRLIPSESMVPTLQIGDRIVVEKVSHWYRPYQRGDILVFYPPEPEAILKHDPWSVFLRLTGFSGILYDKESRIDTAFIKRVVGMPGDTIEVKPGEGVYINGELQHESYINEIANTCTFVNYCGSFTVPPHMYYMMGDNRNHSMDSRWWRFLPEDRVIGRAVFRFYPLDNRLGALDRES